MIKILFLGAGKRVSLFEHIIDNIAEYDSTNLFSIELDDKVPIRCCSKVIVGPKFNNTYFPEFLFDVIIKNNINIIIPCMDNVIGILSDLKNELLKYNCMALVGDDVVSKGFTDKEIAAKLFIDNNINHPHTITAENFNIAEFPLMAKPKKGYGARGQTILNNSFETSRFLLSNEYIVQSFVSNSIEYTVDCYVDRNKKIICCVTRKRLEIINGEVNKTEVIRNKKIEDYARYILSKFNFFGPVTIQMFDTKDEPTVIEINPRFGGGVIASFLAGCKFGEWIYNDYLGKPNMEFDNWDNNFIMVRANREFIIR